jgi:putative Mg2+ transporter-C (MgtC) family protein
MIAANPELGDSLKADFGRLGAQVISGIGFLGAGTIIVRKNSVKGLTTAATLWLTACIGLAVGMGYYAISIISFIFVLIVLLILRFVQVNVSKHKEIVLEIQMFDRKLGMDSIESVCSSKNTKILKVEFKKDQKDEFGNEFCTALYHMQMHRDFDRESLIMDILQQTGIIRISEHKDNE